MINIIAGEDKIPATRQEIIDTVNRARPGWKAGVNARFMVSVTENTILGNIKAVNQINYLYF
jgi:hypothetical protein